MMKMYKKLGLFDLQYRERVQGQGLLRTSGQTTPGTTNKQTNKQRN